MRISDWSSDVCSSDLMYCLLTLTVILISADSSGFGLGHSVFMAGLALVPYSLASVAGSRWAHRVRGRLGPDRKSVVEGKRVSGSVDLGGRRNIKKKKRKPMSANRTKINERKQQ